MDEESECQALANLQCAKCRHGRVDWRHKTRCYSQRLLIWETARTVSYAQAWMHDSISCFYSPTILHCDRRFGPDYRYRREM